jgi:hypothetical protein
MRSGRLRHFKVRFGPLALPNQRMDCQGPRRRREVQRAGLMASSRAKARGLPGLRQRQHSTCTVALRSVSSLTSAGDETRLIAT